MNRIKKLFILLFLIISTLHSAESKYSPFIEEQLVFVEVLNSKDITHEEIEETLDSQKDIYTTALEKIMSNKKSYIDSSGLYDKEIFSLEKIININKRSGNSFAVLRDEVQVKSYKLLINQNTMIKSILSSLTDADKIEFSKSVSKFIEKNKLDNKKLLNVDYSKSLKLDINSKTLEQAKQNIKELYALKDINDDVINYIYLFENKMYSLNKYSKYNLISFVISIRNSEVAKSLDPLLEEYGLDTVKLLIILFLVLIIYIIRKFIYFGVVAYILEIESLKKYSESILKVIYKPFELLIIFININMVVYVYNDFITIEILERFFDIVYTLIMTFIIFKVLNAVALIKVQEIEISNKKIKNEVVNVSIKIINFIIFIIGLLIVLHFAGANLTAVLSGLGIGGFAVALAAKDSLANFFGTLSILLSDVYSQGDWIVSDAHEGVVIEIGLRVTTLRTFDNALVAIPNAILANKEVKNWNKRTLGRRIKMNLGVKYSSKSSDIKNAVREIREMLSNHPAIATEKTSYEYESRRSSKLVSKDDSLGVKKLLFVHLDSFSDSSINIIVYCFSKSTQWAKWLEVKEDVMHKMMEILEANSLEFAFPSLSIYNEKDN